MLGLIRKLISKPVKFNARTICIGNATVGGTGKTQMVIKLAQAFTQRNINFIILCKGYGGKNTHYSLVTNTSSPYDVGDEALELCEYGVTFSVPKISYAPEIIAKYKPDIVLIDDGMQNPNFIKDFVIMTVDGTRGFGNGFPIPAGPMRCRFDDIKADAIIVVGGDVSNIFGRVKNKLNIFHAVIKPTRKSVGTRYYAFAGIGNPDKFFDTLKKAGADLAQTKTFPDHYDYTQADILELFSAASALDAKLITTRKDYVKIRHIFDEDQFDIMDFEREVVGARSEQKPIISVLNINYLEIELDIERFEYVAEMVLYKI